LGRLAGVEDVGKGEEEKNDGWIREVAGMWWSSQDELPQRAQMVMIGSIIKKSGIANLEKYEKDGREAEKRRRTWWYTCGEEGKGLIWVGRV
jgi:hypothetical protein